MLRRTSRRFVAMLNVDNYLSHLYPAAGVEVVPMNDIVPSLGEGIAEAYDFQLKLRQRMLDTGRGNCIGWKTLPPQQDIAKPYKLSDICFAPLFNDRKFVSSSSNATTISMKEHRVKHVEIALAFTIGGQSSNHLWDRITKVSPVIELTGTRFPYCAPHAPGFIADLMGHVALVVSEPMEVAKLQHVKLPSLGCVLTLDDEPLQVGSCGCLTTNGGPQRCVSELAGFLASHGLALADGDIVVTSGVTQRVPAKPGKYVGDFGPLGAVQLTLTH